MTASIKNTTLLPASGQKTALSKSTFHIIVYIIDTLSFEHLITAPSLNKAVLVLTDHQAYTNI